MEVNNPGKTYKDDLKFERSGSNGRYRERSRFDYNDKDRREYKDPRAGSRISFFNDEDIADYNNIKERKIKDKYKDFKEYKDRDYYKEKHYDDRNFPRHSNFSNVPEYDKRMYISRDERREDYRDDRRREERIDERRYERRDDKREKQEVEELAKVTSTNSTQHTSIMQKQFSTANQSTISDYSNSINLMTVPFNHSISNTNIYQDKKKPLHEIIQANKPINFEKNFINLYYFFHKSKKPFKLWTEDQKELKEKFKVEKDILFSNITVPIDRSQEINYKTYPFLVKNISIIKSKPFNKTLISQEELTALRKIESQIYSQEQIIKENDFKLKEIDYKLNILLNN